MHLFVTRDLAVEMLLGELLEVLDLLSVIGIHFRHGSIQHGLTAGRRVLVLLSGHEISRR